LKSVCPALAGPPIIIPETGKNSGSFPLKRPQASFSDADHEIKPEYASAPDP
jgi:hypothetical protein